MTGLIGYAIGNSVIFALIGFAVGKLAVEGSTKKTMAARYKWLAFAACWLAMALISVALMDMPPASASVAMIVAGLVVGGVVSFAFTAWRGIPNSQPSS